MARLLLGPGGSRGGPHRVGVRRSFNQPAADRLRSGLWVAGACRGSPDPVGWRVHGICVAAGAGAGSGDGRLRGAIGGAPHLGVTGSYQQGSLAQTAAPKPNIIFILTDDMRKDDLNNTYMPQTTTQLVTKGRSFQNAFVSNPLCCPSRATIMRGQYSHNNKVWFNPNVFDPDPNIRDGGWKGYNGNGYEADNVATRLQAAGYTTGLFGKYLNGYGATTVPTTVPPGWDDWFAFKQPEYYNYDVNDNGTIRHYGTRSTDYSTDVLKTQVNEFIGATPPGQPFFAYVAPYAPHG